MPKKSQISTDAQPTQLTGDALPTGPAKPTDPMANGPLPAVKKSGGDSRKCDNVPDELQLHHWLLGPVKHLAKIVVHRTNGDVAMALRVVKPGFLDHDYLRYESCLAKNPLFNEALAEEYREIGVDEPARKKLIGVIWSVVMRDPTSKAAQTYIPLLGRAMGMGELADESRKPAELPIKGLDEGVKKMLEGEDADAAQNPTGFATIKDGKDSPEFDE